MRTNKKNRRWILEWGFFLGLLLTLVLTFAAQQYAETKAAVCADTVRLHILANSDRVEDQQLKLKVRDALLEKMPETLGQAETKQQAVEALQAALPQLEETAAETLRKAGSRQKVSIRMEQREFAAKDYGDFALPAGEYTALRVELGRAEGHNWFCVLYPALCINGSTADYATPAENALVFGRYELRLAGVEILRGKWSGG